MTESIKYLAGGSEWKYPSAGDSSPPPKTKVLLLTIGGVCIVGHWGKDCLGWLELPKRNTEKELQIETNA